MRTVLRCLPAVGACALAMGFLALPGQEERVTMLLRDGKITEAQQTLETLYRSGDRRPEIVLQLALIEDEAGDVAQSIGYLETYAALRPNDAVPLQRLVELYEQTGDTDKSFSAMERLLTVAPSQEGADKLLSLYRLLGHRDEEESLLRKLLYTSYISDDGLERLGLLAAGTGDLDVASAALMRLDGQSDPKKKSHRILLFQVLIDQRQYGQAFDDAVRWSAKWRDPASAVEFVLAFARSNQDELAREFSHQAAAAIRDFELTAADALQRHGHTTSARQLLADWIVLWAPRRPKQIDNYIGLTASTGDIGGPFRALRVLAQRPGQEKAAALLAEGVSAAYGPQALSAFRSFLTPRILRERPVFAAQLFLADGNLMLAKYYFALSDLRQVFPEDRSAWLTIAEQVDPQGAYKALIHAWKSGTLPPEFQQTLAELAFNQRDWGLHNAVQRAGNRKNVRLADIKR